MRRTGGFRLIADLEAYGKKLKKEGFYVEVKPFGILRYLEVKSDNLQMKLYLREALAPDKQEELTLRDERLTELIKAKYPYEGIAKIQPSC